MFAADLLLLLLLLAAPFGGALAGECGEPEHKTAEAALREKLFCNYRKSVRPVKYSSNQTVVQIELYPHQISMDEYSEEITIHGYIQFIWTDNFLQWTPSEYEGIQILSMTNEEIWLPDIAVDVPSEGMKLGKTSGSDCLVAYNGKVFCFPVVTIRASCSVDLYRFPFDTQNCTLIFLSPNYSGLHVNLQVLETGVRMSLYRANKVWDIVNFTVKREIARPGIGDNSTFYPYVKCNITVQRHSAEDHVILVLPGLVLAALSLMTFLMDDMHSSRIGVAAMTFLCDLLYCLYFGYRFPASGDKVPLVVTFFRDSLLISGAAIAAAVLNRRLRRATTPPGNWLSTAVVKLRSTFLGRFFFFGGDGNDAANDDDTAEMIEPKKESNSEWSQLAIIIDRVTFAVCLLAHLVLFFFFLP